MTKRTRIAINGFGRIGRTFFRVAHNSQDIEIVAINDLSLLSILFHALKHDSVYRRFPGSLLYNPDRNEIVCPDQQVKLFSERDPGKLPWRELGIDIVVDASGIFDTIAKLTPHLNAGAKRVVLTAPAKDDMPTATPNVGEENLLKGPITSNSSCTTNCANPVVTVLSRYRLITELLISTTHAYTASQSLVDGLGNEKDANRGRAAALNMIPSTTGAAREIGRFTPELSGGRSDGLSVRVPVPAGSLLDLTFLSPIKISRESINQVLMAAAKENEWEGILDVSTEPLVSGDIIGVSYGSTVDLSLTRTTGHLAKVMAWYDNEWGYCSMLLKHIQTVAKLL